MAIVKVLSDTHVWQVRSGEWYAPATGKRYPTRREAIDATRAWDAAGRRSC